MSQAIAVGTQKSYATGVRHFEQYCASRGWDATAVTSARAAEWLAHMADSDRVSTNTISVYRSALSSHYMTTQALTSTAPNPWLHDGIGVMLRGVKRVKAPAEARARDAQPDTPVVDMDMVRTISAVTSHDSEADMMMLAAVALAVAGGLRPSELLGGPKPHLCDRALHVDQLVFFADDTGNHRISDAECAAPDYARIVPYHCVVTLRVSKTDQHHRGVSKQIAAPIAVRALWAWRHMRSRSADSDARLFMLDGVALSMDVLVAYTQRVLRANGHRELTLKAKCFRRGLASTLAAQGVPAADISVGGHWSTKGTMWKTYANTAARDKRARAVNRAM